MRKAIRILTAVLFLYIGLLLFGVIFVNNQTFGTLIIALVVMFIVYKLRRLPKLIGRGFKVIKNKYVSLTPNLLPIQQKVLFVIIVSGLVFFITNFYSLLKFNSLYSQKLNYESREYALSNFMIPHPSFNRQIRAELGYYTSVRSPREWDWFTDEVILSGIIFGLSLFFFLATITFRSIIKEIKG